jgi:hypothetical protein
LRRDHGAVDTVVVWLRVGSDPTSGSPTVSPEAREIRCRFDKTKKTVAGPDGEQIAIDATISGFSIDVPVGSAVWEGRAADLAGTAYLPDRDVYTVATFSADRDRRGRDTYREAGLTFSKDTLPSLSS